MKLGLFKRREPVMLPEEPIEIAVVDDIEGQATQNVFRSMLIAAKDMDYREGCTVGRSGECKKRELLKVLRLQFEMYRPKQFNAGLDGPDVRSFRSLPPFCQACIIAGGRKGIHFPGNVEQDDEEEEELQHDEKTQWVYFPWWTWWPRRSEVLEEELEVYEDGIDLRAAEEVTAEPVPAAVPALMEPVPVQAPPAAVTAAPLIVPKEKEHVVARADFGPKILKTPQDLRTGSKASRAKIYSGIGKIERKTSKSSSTDAAATQPAGTEAMR